MQLLVSEIGKRWTGVLVGGRAKGTVQNINNNNNNNNKRALYC